MIPLLLLLLLQATYVWSARDNDYYYPSFTNPNTEYHMYWKDSVNVLEDLDQFESLYITYHRCIWSKYGTRYGTGEDYDEQGGDDNDDSFSNGCGGFGGGEYYWYMGRTQCFKANVAYSLYGVLKGDDPKKRKGSFCHGDTYINSFFTTFGVESFAGPMGLSTSAANSVCTSTQGGNGANNDFSYAQVDDDYLSDDYTFYDSEAYTSQGTGCSAKGHFVTDSYNGPFCHGKDYDSTLNELEDFNAALQEMQCTEIYSASSNYDERRLDENYDFDYDFEDYPAYQILAFSKSCSVAQYPNDCPDPYGKKRKYAQNIQRALAYKTGRYRDLTTNILKAVSWVLFGTAVALVAGIYYMSQQQSSKSRKQERHKRRQLRNKQSKDDEDASTVIERGIESTLSNLSGNTDNDSRASSRKSKHLGLPKLKLPKKLRKGTNKAAEARDASDINVIDRNGTWVVQVDSTPFDEATTDASACATEEEQSEIGGYSVESTLADYQVYHDHDDATIEEKMNRTLDHTQPQGEAFDDEDLSQDLTAYITMDDDNRRKTSITTAPQEQETEVQSVASEDPSGYITMENLLVDATSFLEYATNSFSTTNNGDQDEREGELVVERAATWGMAPTEDDSTVNSGRSSVMAKGGALAMGAAAGVAAVAAAAMGTTKSTNKEKDATTPTSPKSSSKSKIPKRLRAIGKSMRSSKNKKSKQLKKEQEQGQYVAPPPPPIQQEETSPKEEVTTVTPVPVPVTKEPADDASVASTTPSYKLFKAKSKEAALAPDDEVDGSRHSDGSTHLVISSRSLQMSQTETTTRAQPVSKEVPQDQEDPIEPPPIITTITATDSQVSEPPADECQRDRVASMLPSILRLSNYVTATDSQAAKTDDRAVCAPSPIVEESNGVPETPAEALQKDSAIVATTVVHDHSVVDESQAETSEADTSVDALQDPLYVVETQVEIPQDDTASMQSMQKDPSEPVEQSKEVEYDMFSFGSSEEEEDDDSAIEHTLAEHTQAAKEMKKKKKKKRIFRKSEVKSPIRSLFTKSAKTLSPSQMATAPVVPVLVTPPSARSQSEPPTSPSGTKPQKKMRFFSKSFAKKAPVSEEMQQPQEIPSDVPSDEETDLNTAKASSFDLTNMIQIIEPVVPPESQKGLFSSSPPMSQKSFTSSTTSSPGEKRNIPPF